MNVAIVKMPYSGARNVPEFSSSPDYVETGGLHDRLRELGVGETAVATVRLGPTQDGAYGSWHRMGLACGNLAAIIADRVRKGALPVGLLANCTGLLGMLSGLQRSTSRGEGCRVGMLFIDAHADFNTPETTLSGMLGGMPVAVAAGLCLSRLRGESGLEPALPCERIVLAGLRDVDPEERALLGRYAVQEVPLEELRSDSETLRAQVDRLAGESDALYVHVDVDVLDPAEVPGHHTPVPGGPSSAVVARALGDVFRRCPVATALGIASVPPAERDKGGAARRAAHVLVEAAVEGKLSGGG